MVWTGSEWEIYIIFRPKTIFMTVQFFSLCFFVRYWMEIFYFVPLDLPCSANTTCNNAKIYCMSEHMRTQQLLVISINGREVKSEREREGLHQSLLVCKRLSTACTHLSNFVVVCFYSLCVCHVNEPFKSLNYSHTCEYINKSTYRVYIITFSLSFFFYTCTHVTINGYVRMYAVYVVLSFVSEWKL